MTACLIRVGNDDGDLDVIYIVPILICRHSIRVLLLFAWEDHKLLGTVVEFGRTSIERCRQKFYYRQVDQFRLRQSKSHQENVSILLVPRPQHQNLKVLFSWCLLRLQRSCRILIRGLRGGTSRWHNSRHCCIRNAHVVWEDIWSASTFMNGENRICKLSINKTHILERER